MILDRLRYEREQNKYTSLETFMGVDQRTGEGSKQRIPLVVSKSDRDHGTATTAHRTLGLTPAGNIFTIVTSPSVSIIYLR